LDPKAIQTGAFTDGNPKDAQSPSLISKNNFVRRFLFFFFFKFPSKRGKILLTF
jgi:hypothetical protein